MHRLALLSWFSLLIYFLSPAISLPTGGKLLGIHTNLTNVLWDDSTNQVCEASVHCQSDDLGASRVETSVRRRLVRLNLTNNWHIVYEAFRIFLPAERVIPVLEKFYFNFRADVRTEWWNTPALGHFKVRQGMIELEFWSPTGVIPWPWISTFADVLLELTRQGQSGEMNAVFFDAIGGQIVVAQRIVMAAAAA